jgi:hypothetical protein
MMAILRKALLIVDAVIQIAPLFSFDRKRQFTHMTVDCKLFFLSGSTPAAEYAAKYATQNLAADLTAYGSRGLFGHAFHQALSTLGPP